MSSASVSKVPSTRSTLADRHLTGDTQTHKVMVGLLFPTQLVYFQRADAALG